MVKARDLLENLLVRDPSKRFNLLKVKRQPWFLVNYDGDDAKLLKKRPFYKNHKHSSNSTPSSPMVAPSSKDSLPLPPQPRSSSSNGVTSGNQFPPLSTHLNTNGSDSVHQQDSLPLPSKYTSPISNYPTDSDGGTRSSYKLSSSTPTAPSASASPRAVTSCNQLAGQH